MTGVIVRPVTGPATVHGVIPAEVEGAPPLAPGHGRIFASGRVLDVSAGIAASIADAFETAMAQPARMAPPELEL